LGLDRLGIKARERARKYPQTIWLEQEDFAWVAQNAAQLGMALNEFISAVLKRAREFCERGEWAPLQVVERTRVEKEVRVMCPFCGKEFEDSTKFGKHVEEERDHVIDFFESRWGVGMSFRGNYVCPKCDLRFETKKELIAHIHSELAAFVGYIREEVRKK